VFVGAWLHPEQFRHASVQFADRVRVKDLLFERDAVAFAAPFAAAAEIARAIQCHHHGTLERRWQVSGSGVRRVMIDRDHARFREPAQGHGQLRSGRQGTSQRHIVHLLRRDFRDAEASRDGGFGQPPGLRAPRQFGFFHRGGDLAVPDHGRRRVAQNSADSENVHG
jgi:hypothetical protein